MAAGALAPDLGSGGVAAWVRGRPVVVGLVAAVVLLVCDRPGRRARVRPDRSRLRRIGVILWRTLGLRIGLDWTRGERGDRLGPAPAARPDRDGHRVRARGRRRHVPGPAPQPAGRPVRAGHRVGRGARGGGRRPDPDPDRASSSSASCTGFAFAGALLSAYVVFRLGGSGGAGGLTRLLLTGYAVGSVLAALLTMAMYVSGADLRQIFSFLLGGLAGRRGLRLAIAAPLIVGACVLMMLRCASPRRPAPRRCRGEPPRHRRPARTGHPAGPGLAGDRGRGRDQRAHRLRRPRRAPRRPARRRPGGAAGAADLGDRRAPPCCPRPISSPASSATSRSGVVMALLGAPFFLFLLQRTRSSYEL